MVDHIEALFPSLGPDGFSITSPQNPDYNCIAWAAGDVSRWWWPSTNPQVFWPAGVPLIETLASFQQAFETLGYSTCPGADLEPGFEKLAIFADTSDLPTHAARQLSSGRWTSKLGELEDFEHALYDLEGLAYGRVALLLKRELRLVATQQ
jgi:hypothetical protein